MVISTEQNTNHTYEYDDMCTAGEAVQDVQKRTRGEWDGGVENKNTHNTQTNLNKQKLGEPYVYLKPVEQTLYSARVPIKKRAGWSRKKLKKLSFFGLWRAENCPYGLWLTASGFVFVCGARRLQGYSPSATRQLCLLFLVKIRGALGVVQIICTAKRICETLVTHQILGLILTTMRVWRSCFQVSWGFVLVTFMTKKTSFLKLWFIKHPNLNLEIVFSDGVQIKKIYFKSYLNQDFVWSYLKLNTPIAK